MGVGATANVLMATTTSIPNPINVTVTPDTGAVSVPSPVTIPAGSSVNIPVTGLTTVGSPATIDVILPAGAGGNTLNNVITATVGAPAWTVTPDPATIVVGASQQFTVALNSALASDSTFPLSASVTNFSFPPSVTIPAGQLSATFTVNAIQVGAAADLTGDGACGLLPATELVSITVTGLTLQITPDTVGPLMLGGGQTFTVTIDQVQATALDVTLSDDSPKTSVPASVQIPAGATQTTFVAIAEQTGPAGVVTITGTLPSAVGGDTDTALITAVIPLTIAASPSNVNIAAATEQVITVTTGVTLAKNVTLPLSTSNPVIVGLFTNPIRRFSNPTGSVIIPAGSNSATFRVRGVGVGSGIAVWIDTPADLGGTNPAPEAMVTVNVLGLQLQFNVAAWTVAHGGTSAPTDLEAILTDGGGSTITTVIPVTVRLTSADPTSVLLRGPGGDPNGASPIDIVIPAGDDRENFRVFGNSPGGPVRSHRSAPAAGRQRHRRPPGRRREPAGGVDVQPRHHHRGDGGGTSIVITGSASHSFWNNAQVTFDGVPATVTLQTPSALTVTTPAGTAGPAASSSLTRPCPRSSPTSSRSHTSGRSL